MTDITIPTINLTAHIADTSIPTIASITKHIAIVVPNAREREELQRRLDPDMNLFRVISANQHTQGMRFQTVLITEGTVRVAQYKGRVANERFEKWVENELTRRVPEGQVVYL